MRHVPFTKGLISLASEVTQGIAFRLLPQSGIKGVCLLLFSAVLLLFFMAFGSFALWEILLLLSLPTWGASLIIACACLLALVITLFAAKRALSPRREEKINANDLLGAFLDGLFGRD